VVAAKRGNASESADEPYLADGMPVVETVLMPY